MRRLATFTAIGFALSVIAAACEPAATSGPSPSGPARSGLIGATSEPRASERAASSPPSPSTGPGGTGWFSAGTMHFGRLNTSLVSITGGRVLAVGGGMGCVINSPAAPNENHPAEIWDPDTSDWTAGPSLPRARAYFIAVPLPDGSAMVSGGVTSDPPQSFSSTFRFDPDRLKWIRSGDLNTARSGPAAAILADGRVLIAGGTYMDWVTSFGRIRDLDTVELFDPVEESWTKTTSMGLRVINEAVGLSDGRVLVIGAGKSEVFDPSTARWSPGGELRSAESVVALNDGSALALNEGRALRFVPETREWVPTGPMVTQNAGRRALVALADGRALAAGGVLFETFPYEYVAAAEVYDPAADTWTTTAAMPTPRGGGTTLLLTDGSVLLAGGVADWPETDDLGNCGTPAVDALRFVPD